MPELGRIMMGIGGLLLINGCRTATRVSSVPRVDLSLEGGNRGYVVGTPPAVSHQRTTREMVTTDIELPSFYKPKPSRTPIRLEDMAPPETDMSDETEPAREWPASQQYETYVVKPGESLWSIAAKPEVYGKATRWQRIFDANRDLLKSPDRLRAGMRLKIPKGGAVEETSADTTYSDEGVSFKK